MENEKNEYPPGAVFLSQLAKENFPSGDEKTGWIMSAISGAGPNNQAAAEPVEGAKETFPVEGIKEMNHRLVAQVEQLEQTLISITQKQHEKVHQMEALLMEAREYSENLEHQLAIAEFGCGSRDESVCGVAPESDVDPITKGLLQSEP